MKPIPTWYNGVLHRSRSEARFSVMATALGLQARYEVEGFEGKNAADRNLPDFYLPTFDLWVETSPDEPTKAKWAIHREFDRHHTFFTGSPSFDGALQQFCYRFSRFDHSLSRATDHLFAVCSTCHALSIVPREWTISNAPMPPNGPLAAMCDCIQKENARFMDARIMGALHLASEFNFDWRESQKNKWNR